MNPAEKKARFAPPSEEQTRAWLAWLARGMQREGQTIFQIEWLQPSWLATAHQRWSYYGISRLLQGLMIGLILGFIEILISGQLVAKRGLALVSVSMFFSIPPGMFAGFTSGLIEAARARRSSEVARRSTRLRLLWLAWPWLQFSLIFSLSSGLYMALVVWIILGFPSAKIGLPSAMDAGLNGAYRVFILGSLPALFWARYRANRRLDTDIRASKSLRISRAKVAKGLALGSITGSLLSLIFYLAIEKSPIIKAVFKTNAWTFLSVTLLSTWVGGLMSIVQPAIRGLGTKPHEGIQLSWRNGVTVACLCSLSVIPLSFTFGWEAGISTASAIWVFAFLWSGGLEAAQHYLLRFLLWRSGVMPRRYADFLDYAANELHLLQKVGGGYIFLHRYLLEHFAAMPLPEKAARPARPQESPA